MEYLRSKAIVVRRFAYILGVRGAFGDRWGMGPLGGEGEAPPVKGPRNELAGAGGPWVGAPGPKESPPMHFSTAASQPQAVFNRSMASPKSFQVGVKFPCFSDKVIRCLLPQGFFTSRVGGGGA